MSFHDYIDIIAVILLFYCAIVITPAVFLMIKERFFEPSITVSEMYDRFYDIIKDREEKK